MKSTPLRITMMALSTSLILGGCAAPGGTGRVSGDGGITDAGSLKQMCSPMVVGLGAALACGALARGNNRVKGAAACAAIAVTACYLANSYQAEQTRSAQQVQDEYLASNKQLPAQTQVTSYRAEVSPPGAVRRGQDVTVRSRIVAVPGRNDRNVAIEEEIAIYDGQGESWGQPSRKKANASNQAGEFNTSYTIPVSNEMSQGVYTVRRALYVNGAAVQRDNSGARFQVVQTISGTTIALLAD
jgi:hypothetical protein